MSRRRGEIGQKMVGKLPGTAACKSRPIKGDVSAVRIHVCALRKPRKKKDIIISGRSIGRWRIVWWRSDVEEKAWLIIGLLERRVTGYGWRDDMSVFERRRFRTKRYARLPWLGRWLRLWDAGCVVGASAHVGSREVCEDHGEGWWERSCHGQLV